MLELIDISWIGERWSLASLPNGEPVALFIWRDRDIDASARCGDVLPAIVRSIDRSGRMGFVDLSTGEQAFFNISESRTPPIVGAHINVSVRAEAYGDKLANVSPTSAQPVILSESDAQNAWLERLPGYADLTDELSFVQKAEMCRAAIDVASASTVTIDNGGELHFDHTRALTAIDVDSSGRVQRSGVPGLNTDALATAARHINLRRLAGLFVVDLEGAPKGEKAKGLAAQFQASLKALTGRTVRVLPPSVFGLIEATVARREKPLFEITTETCSAERRTMEAFLSAMREALTLAESDRSAFFALKTSAALTEYMKQTAFDWQGELKARTGGRIRWEPLNNAGLDYQIELI
ncbi:ribonuclease E/G [Ponticaulis koreensis]|uniref:ribonuclease E/G n=1 Tax=Ponticaulis koreensis TaxID=1123045 RepID=UPI0003B4C2FB|nr:ribonuclease E/G [Ponticaulis koreensis]